jgi:hypothetical protein
MSDLDDFTIPIPSEDPDDPVNVVYDFIIGFLGERSKGKVPIDRERLIITLTLAMLTDPNHRVGKTIGRDLFKVWIDRGGKIPKRGLGRRLCEPDQFEFAMQYLYDHGMTLKEIANVFGIHWVTVHRVLKYLREADQKLQLDVDPPNEPC